MGYSRYVVPHERVAPRTSAAIEQRLMSRPAGGGTRCRVPPPDPLFPEDRGSSFARFSGIGISLFLWGRNPLNLVLQTGRVSARAAQARCFVPQRFLFGERRLQPSVKWAGIRPVSIHSEDSGPSNSKSDAFDRPSLRAIRGCRIPAVRGPESNRFLFIRWIQAPGKGQAPLRAQRAGGPGLCHSCAFGDHDYFTKRALRACQRLRRFSLRARRSPRSRAPTP